MNGIWFNVYLGDITLSDNKGVRKLPCYVRSKQIKTKSLNEGIPKSIIEDIEDQFHWALMNIDKHIRRAEWKKGVA